MSFNSPLTGGQITQVRKDTQAFEHYVLITPNDIVWQAEVNEDFTNLVFAEFLWTNSLQGAFGDVIEGQIILITESDTDFSAPIVRGRVRKVPDATSVFINEIGTNISTGMYITVIDDFDIMERLPKLTDGVQFKDWDIAYQELPPLIAGLQSAYVDFSGSNPVAFSFSPTAVATEFGASISTWAWDIGDGSFTGGTSSSDQNIQCTFPGESVNEHRWVHLTVTDDNGISTTFHFQVFTVDKNSSSVVLLDSGELTITASIEDGYNTSITAWDGVGLTEILDQTRVVIAGIDTYDVDGTPTQTVINTNILMIGRFRNEISITEPDDDASIVVDGEFTVEGFATQLARLAFLPQQVLDDDTPTAWGDITDPDPVRVIVYILAYHTTFPNVSSITIEDLSAYIIGSTNLSDTNALENVEQIADVVKALPVYAPSGETTIQRNANYLSDTDRDALDTIFDFEDEDYTGLPSLALEYGTLIGQATTAAIVYDSTANQVGQNWVARSPAESYGNAYEQVQTVNQVLEADSSEADARSEIRQRIANDLAFVNPKPVLDVELMDGFRWIIPTLHQWWTHTLSTALTARQRTYSTSNRWWLASITYTAIPAENSSALQAQFILETQSTNAGISPTLVPDVNALQLSFPPLSASDYFVDDPLVNHPIDDPSDDYPFSGQAIGEPTPPGNNGDMKTGQEVLNVSMKTGVTVATTRLTTFGETYTITVEGDGVVVNETEWAVTFNYDTTSGLFSPVVATDLQTEGTYRAGQGGWIQTRTAGTGANTFCGIGRAFGENCTLEYMDLLYDLTNSGTWDGVSPDNQVQLRSPNITLDSVTASSDTSGTDKVLSWSGSQACTSATEVVPIIHSGRKFDGASGDEYGSLVIKRLHLSGIVASPGDPFPFNLDSGSRGDAFYKGYDTKDGASLYAGSNGLQLDTSRPSGIGPYDSGHSYTFQAAGTGAKFFFRFLDGDYTDNSRSILKVTVTGPNMGLTP